MPTKPKRLLVLFGNQLFSNRHIAEAQPDAIFMAESDRMCRRYKAHQHKLVLVLSAMRSKADALRKAGYRLAYEKLEDGLGESFGAILSAHLSRHAYDELVYFQTESPGMEAALGRCCAERGLEPVRLTSPMFITAPEELESFRSEHKRLFMADFYRWQRRRMRVLVDDEGAPVGGRWSFDEDNRKKLPKDLAPPPLPKPRWTKHVKTVVELVAERFDEHPGQAEAFWLPTTESQAKAALRRFLEERFHFFGDYEDALSKKHATVFHSVLSPLLNIGLLTPAELVDEALQYAANKQVPLNSLEGFVRQLIGWREFIRAVWRVLPSSHWRQNFWGHERKLSRHWYDGSTGLPPLDDAIRRANATGYNHHIERLMVLGNFMLLCRVEPESAYHWFMQMYVDSADWVMAPNVYGMALFSEGGAFTTKPYICGSNYLRKMSDYGKGPWCDISDGLYWSFVDAQRSFFEKNPRSRMLLGTLDRMERRRRERIFGLAEQFIDQVTE